MIRMLFTWLGQALALAGVILALTIVLDFAWRLQTNRVITVGGGTFVPLKGHRVAASASVSQQSSPDDLGEE